MADIRFSPTLPSRLTAVLLTAVIAGACALPVTGCAVTPSGAVVVEPGIAYVAPTYDIPGPGYEWRYHPTYGWGWRHPNYGWHRGWR